MNIKIKAILVTLLILGLMIGSVSGSMFLIHLIPERWLIENGGLLGAGVLLIVCVYLLYGGVYNYYRLREAEDVRSPDTKIILTEEEMRRINSVWRAPSSTSPETTHTTPTHTTTKTDQTTTKSAKSKPTP